MPISFSYNGIIYYKLPPKQLNKTGSDPDTIYTDRLNI
jgi:hypothetical protein